MYIYNYSRDTFEFTIPSEARVDPKDKNNYLKPAYSTFIQPPSVGLNEVATFNEGLDDWEVKPDYRGEVYYLKSDGSKVDFAIGDVPDTTMQLTFPVNLQTANDEIKRKLDIKSAGVALINAKYPHIYDLDAIKFYRDFYMSIDASVRAPLPNIQYCIDVYQTANAAITNGTAVADIVWPT